MFGRIQLRPRATLAVLLLAVLVAPAIVANDAAVASTERELDETRRYAAELDRRIASAETELATIVRGLEDLATELEVAASELEVAEAAYTAAEGAWQLAADRAADVDRRLVATRATQDANNEVLRDVARDTYKHGMAATSPQVAIIEIVGSSDADGLSDRIHFLHHSLGERTAALEAAEVLVIQVETLAELAQDEAAEAQRLLVAADEARAATAEVHARSERIMAETSVKLARQDELLVELEEARAQASMRIEDLEEQLEQERLERERIERERRERERREREEREERERLEREQRERDARAERERQQRQEEQARDAERRDQQQRAEREERERKEREERERKDRERADRERSESRPAAGSSSGSRQTSGSGGSSGGVSSTPASGGLVTVGGITVAASLAPNLEALLNHARADGVVLGGSGYRSPEVTAQLRRINGCPDVYDSPASACRVPTARPGTSEHEKGLAVDFTYQGQTICFPRPGSQCSGNAGFAWLKANAGKYGLKNLSTEAWHWSTTGR